MNERPDGSIPTLMGWILVIVGIFSALFVVITETPTTFWLATTLAQLGVGLGVLLLSLGYLVRAIWFLPERERSEDGAILRKCDYCGFKAAEPSIPCSAVPTDHLMDNAHRIDSERCITALKLRGFLPE
jgi:hypothetical protein